MSVYLFLCSSRALSLSLCIIAPLRASLAIDLTGKCNLLNIFLPVMILALD